MEASVASRIPRLPLYAAVPLLCAGLILGGCSASTTADPAAGGPRAAAMRPGGSDIITAEQIANYPSTASVEDILERHFSGLRSRRRHEPGGLVRMQVLGMGPPLYVVDGVPLSPSGNLGLNPRDIESIEVVKYGGRTAEYGLRGANGVVIIRTKQGTR